MDLSLILMAFSTSALGYSRPGTSTLSSQEIFSCSTWVRNRPNLLNSHTCKKKKITPSHRGSVKSGRCNRVSGGSGVISEISSPLRTMERTTRYHSSRSPGHEMFSPEGHDLQHTHSCLTLLHHAMSTVAESGPHHPAAAHYLGESPISHLTPTSDVRSRDPPHPYLYLPNSTTIAASDRDSSRLRYLGPYQRPTKRRRSARNSRMTSLGERHDKRRVSHDFGSDPSHIYRAHSLQLHSTGQSSHPLSPTFRTSPSYPTSARAEYGPYNRATVSSSQYSPSSTLPVSRSQMDLPSFTPVHEYAVIRQPPAQVPTSHQLRTELRQLGEPMQNRREPPYPFTSYAVMLADIITNSPMKKMTLEGLYDYLKLHYPRHFPGNDRTNEGNGWKVQRP